MASRQPTAPQADTLPDLSTIHTIVYGDGSVTVTLDAEKARAAEAAGAEVTYGK